jgi:hypothetical protein
MLQGYGNAVLRAEANTLQLGFEFRFKLEFEFELLSNSNFTQIKSK